jgi:hypothetical protein
MVSKSKQSALDAVNPGRDRTEFTLKCGKQALFTHTDLDVVKQRRTNQILSDSENGKECEYTITKRVVVYEGEGEIPTGENGLGLKGEVTETDEV